MDAVDNIYVTDLTDDSVKRISLDADQDGIPDFLEHGGGAFVPGVDDRGVDADGDGMSNAAEYIAGTDPQDPQSHLRLYDHRGPDGTVSVSWYGVPGRGYRLWASVDLVHWTREDANWIGDGQPIYREIQSEPARYFMLEVFVPQPIARSFHAFTRRCCQAEERVMKSVRPQTNWGIPPGTLTSLNPYI